MATTKITSPDLFNLESLNTALKLPSGTTAQRPTSPSTGEWRYNTTTNYVEYYDGAEWRDLQSENIPPVNSENFNTVLYTGNSGTQAITGVGFKPDFVWTKARNQSGYSHFLTDSTRGGTKVIESNSTAAEITRADNIQSFDSDGFTLGADGTSNYNGTTYVAWCWKADAGTKVTNNEGSIQSSVQVNNKAGFSIIEYTGANSSGTGTFGHGLSTAPTFFIIRDLDGNSNWIVWADAIGDVTKNLQLQSTSGTFSANIANSTAPSSTVISISTDNDVNNNGQRYICYAFAPVAGYSSFGSYTGNGSTTGPIINTAFEPAFLIVKRTDSSANWRLVDNKRSPSNPRQKVLFPNLNNAESDVSDDAVDFLTNGFQIKNNDSSWNNNGGAYIYIAFGSDASAAPTLADSFANKIYDGNGGTQSITGLGFSPSWVWAKRRSATEDHAWFDILRGVERQIASNKTNGQNTTTNGISSFDTDGWTTGANNALNTSGQTYVAWNWKANPVPTINTDGTIQSLVSANQAAGFSIVKWTTNGSASQYVGHGLSVAPSIIIYKRLDGSQDWFFETDIIGGSYNYLNLNTSGAVQAGGAAWSTRSTSTTISAFTSSNNLDYIAYCFTSISGFSSFGTYTGNSSTQSITGLGFQPNWLMIKQTNGSNSWRMFDSARGLSAPQTLFANLDSQEDSESNTVSSFDSDGWTMGSQQGVNDNGDTYLYMAFKENPTLYPAAGNMSFLVVAGGGGGARYGGGGTGGYRNSYANEPSGGNSSSEADISLSAGTYTVTIGAGGNAGNRSAGSAGGNSSINSIIANGGGEGVRWPNNTAQSTQNGGSGGGQDNDNSGTNSAGTTVATNDGKTQGTAGGALGYGSGITYYGAGGGGAGVAGSSSTQGAGNPGAGGNGLSSSITGTSITRGGGGGGGNGGQASPKGVAGTGGGGEGTAWNNGETANGTNGTTNYGGGGGAGMSGGSGVVILRLLTSEYSSSTTGSPTVTTDGDYTILTYTGSGTYVHS